MKIVEAQEVRRRLTVPVCLDLMRDALAQLARGQADQPPRSICRFPGDNAFGFMPAWLAGGGFFGAKVITAFPGNHGTAYPSHMGYVLIFETEHGSMVGMAGAWVITEIRTGAVSAVATDLLARKDASRLALMGAGAQARSHLAAITAVRPIRAVTVYDLSPAAAQSFAREAAEQYGLPVRVCASPREAAADADIICTLTPAKEPYLRADDVKPGAHINAVGAFSPTTREVDGDLVARSLLYADQRAAMERECGEYLIPLCQGLITPEHIRGNLGGLLLGRCPGREREEDITLFDALGLAVEDMACGGWLCLDPT